MAPPFLFFSFLIPFLLPFFLVATAAPSATPNTAIFLHAWDTANSLSPANQRRGPEPPGYLNAFGGNGCYGDAGYQGGPMDPGPFCFRVADKGSVHWTGDAERFNCTVWVWSGTNCKGERTTVKKGRCVAVKFGSMGWFCVENGKDGGALVETGAFGDAV